LRARLGEGERTASGAPQLELHANAGATAFAPRARRAATLAFAASGFCSLLYEVVWSRALVNTIGGSVYAFALILMTFLVGIAAGSGAASSALADAKSRGRGLQLASFVLAAIAPLPIAPRFGMLAWLGESSLLAALVALAVVGAQRKRRERAW